MAELSENSYGTIVEVEALARHLLEGRPHFSDDTEPTQTEVVDIMDRISAILNMALSSLGLTIPIDETAAVLACGDFVVRQTVCQLRLAYPHLGIGGEEVPECEDVVEAAYKFAELNEEAFKNLGGAVEGATSEGLDFTALDVHSSRSDPDNTNREQPIFRRRLFRGF